MAAQERSASRSGLEAAGRCCATVGGGSERSGEGLDDTGAYNVLALGVWYCTSGGPPLVTRWRQ